MDTDRQSGAPALDHTAAADRTASLGLQPSMKLMHGAAVAAGAGATALLDLMRAIYEAVISILGWIAHRFGMSVSAPATSSLTTEQLTGDQPIQVQVQRREHRTQASQPGASPLRMNQTGDHQVDLGDAVPRQADASPAAANDQDFAMEVRRLQEELDALLVMLETMLRREFTNPVRADASSNALSPVDIRSAQDLAQSLYRRLQSFFDAGQALRTGRGEIAGMSIFQACDQTDATSPETVEGSKQSRWRLQGAGPQMAEARVTAVPDGLRSSDGAPRPTRPDEEPVTEGGAEETRRYRQGQRH